jgi:hypothetical protein
VTGVTVVGVRGHLLAVEAHVGRGLPSGARRFVYVEGRGSSASAPQSSNAKDAVVADPDQPVIGSRRGWEA